MSRSLQFRYGLSWSTTHPPRIPSSNITKNAETHPSPIRDVIIEQPLCNNLFKVNNRNFRRMREICSKLTIKTPERRHWRRSSVFIVTLNI